jgi:hypothetical protein
VRGACGAAEDGTYKVFSRSGPEHLGKSEGLILLMKPTDSITAAREGALLQSGGLYVRRGR